MCQQMMSIRNVSHCIFIIHIVCSGNQCIQQKVLALLMCSLRLVGLISDKLSKNVLLTSPPFAQPLCFSTSHDHDATTAPVTSSRLPGSAAGVSIRCRAAGGRPRHAGVVAAARDARQICRRVGNVAEVGQSSRSRDSGMLGSCRGGREL